MPDLLLELFSEEIPARMQARAAADLDRLMAEGLKPHGLIPTASKAFATPRRLTLVMTGLPVAGPDVSEEKKGPRVGAPEKATEGFLKSAGLTRLDEADIREDKKGQFYVATIEKKGQPTADVVAGLVPELIAKFPWPKSMRWGGIDNTLRWVRPLQSILCTFDGEVVPFSVENGDRPITSGDITFGHRFMAPDKLQVRSFDAYAEALKRAKVMLDPAEREEHILGEARALCAAQGLELVEDESLLREVAGLAEWPSPRIGAFADKFLTVPDEVLTASMKGHQKYFSVRDPGSGRLAPRFICVANIEPADGGKAMMTGYERVLEARLSDGWFLYHQDLKKPLPVHAEKLKDVTFFEGLGTTWDKVERVAALAREIAPKLGADPDTAAAAARLSKADLPTEMVGEFPELQGIMGRYYYLEEAKARGGPTAEDAAIADAIRDHYKPAGQGDDVPTAPVSVAVALADKLATLAMFWSIGEKPTGSKDPFALRRMALGVIQIVLENDLRIGLKQTFGNLVEAPDLLSFFHDRLRVYLRDEGYRHDHIDAVLTPQADDFVLVVAKLDALRALLGTEDGQNLTAAFKRAGNILKAEEKKGALPEGAPAPAELTEPAEVSLWDAFTAARAETEQALATEDFARAMTTLSTLRAPLDRFFEDVTVNADDAALRANRLKILTCLTDLCTKVADFTRLEG